MNTLLTDTKKPGAFFKSSAVRENNGIVQRKCACGGSGATGECPECEKKKRVASRTTDLAQPGHDFGRVRVRSEAEGESLRSIPPQPGLPATGNALDRLDRLKEHRFLCPPVADSLTNISKAGKGGGTLGFTKIDQSSNLLCLPKFDIDAKAGTCSFQPISTSLSITSKFPSVTGESVTSDSLPVPGCGNKQVPIYGKVTQATSDLAKAGEQEHCDDLTIAFNQTLKPCADAVNKFAGTTFTGKTQVDCVNALIAKLGFDCISCSEEFADLTKKDDERDSKGMHDFDFDLISKDCTKIVAGYKRAPSNKIGDPSVAPAKFIPAASKCGKAAPAAPAPKSSAPPGSSGTPAPPPAPAPKKEKDKGGG